MQTTRFLTAVITLVSAMWFGVLYFAPVASGFFLYFGSPFLVILLISETYFIARECWLALPEERAALSSFFAVVSLAMGGLALAYAWGFVQIPALA